MADPVPSFQFLVHWEGTRIGFAEVSGLEMEHEVVEYREGTMPRGAVQKLPGLKKYGDITLKRGIVHGDNEIFEWFDEIKFGRAAPRSVTISILNENQDPIVTWKVVNAWPRKIVGPTLDAKSSAVAIEEMVLACDEIILENG
jgi:phage tail-like protein